MDSFFVRSNKVKYNLILFAATLATTIIAGAIQEGVNPLNHPDRLYRGLPFAITIILILGAHELGHYVMSKRNGVRATLPYFIPSPSFIGTFGAFIKIKSPIPDRNVLLKIGAAGPFAGFAVSLPALIIGLALSKVKEARGIEESIMLGSPLILSILTKLVLGVYENEANIILHPIAFAAWIGMFVTALNLLPIGQLDGGHITYSLFGKQHNKISKMVFFLLLPMGFLWEGWFVWAAIAYLLVGFNHPPLVYEEVILQSRERTTGYLAILLFLLTFTPIPFKL